MPDARSGYDLFIAYHQKKAARRPHKYKDEETVNPQTERESKAKRLARFIAYWQITPV
jgi:hypothetical protein